MHCSLPDPSARGILQERIMEWTAIPFSMIFPTQGSNLDIPWILQADSFLSEPPGKLICFYLFFFWGGAYFAFSSKLHGNSLYNMRTNILLILCIKRASSQKMAYHFMFVQSSSVLFLYGDSLHLQAFTFIGVR